MTMAALDPVFKVHYSMCSELKRVTDKALEILPQIEAAKPGGSSGIRALCMLSNSIEKSYKILEYSSQSSKLYLAITGDTMLLRCRNLKGLLENGLSLLLTMVPVSLSLKISHVADEMRAACFSLDPSEEEVGKALRGLILEDGCCPEKGEREIVLFAASKLGIRSNKDVVLEERAIRRILSKLDESQERKKKILKYLLVLMKKYGKNISEDVVPDEKGDAFDVCSSDLSSNSEGSSVADAPLPNVDDTRVYLENDENSIDFTGGIEPLIRFIQEALDGSDLARLRIGLDMLMMMEERRRFEIVDGIEKVLPLLVSILKFEVTDEALLFAEILSSQRFCGVNFAAAGLLLPIVELLSSSKKKNQEFAVRILLNLSSEEESCSQIVELECVPKLVAFINDAEVGSPCIKLLRNLCAIEEARVSVAEADGSIAAIAELLENGVMEEQEHAVEVIFSLCSTRVEYCHLVMKEMIIPSLVYISTNATEKGKARAVELLRQLRDVNFEERAESVKEEVDGKRQGNYAVEEKKVPINLRKSSRRNISFFRKLMISSR